MSEDSHLADVLQDGLRQLGFEGPLLELLHYVSLLYQWNQAYNLTAIRNKEEMVTRHVLDSLAILPWVRGRRWLDVGTGAGLPGIPLALAVPNAHVVLLDSNGKKVRFLREVKRSLSLDNVDIVHTRVENYHPPQGFDTVTSRAFSSLQHMLDCTSHVIDKNGVWLLMKGRRPDGELAAVSRPYHVESYRVPGVDEERCCVMVQACQDPSI